MVLNKKDRDVYIKFIREAKEYNDHNLYYYSSIINNFIVKNYDSNANRHYDLDDFIQEAFILIINKKDDLDNINEDLDNLYNSMNRYGELENKQIDVKKYINTLENDKEKEVLRALLIDEDLYEKAIELNISNSELKNIVLKLLCDLEKNIEDNNVDYVEEDDNYKKR